MPTTIHEPSQRNAGHSRRTILEAAKREFAELGVDGARIDAIARAAGLNKALLYYYFHDKESLYGAVLDDVFAERFQGLKSILDSDLPPGEKILRFARQHFDYVSDRDHYPRLVQFEMMRAASGNAKHLPRLIESFFRPMLQEVTRLVRQGMATQQIRRVDPTHLVLSIIGVNVFHVVSAPITSSLIQSHSESIAERRAATLDFIAASIFNNREEGIGLAARIVSEPSAPADAIAASAPSLGPPAAASRSIRGTRK